MATEREEARTHSMRTRYRKAIDNGISLISPMWRMIVGGLDRQVKKPSIGSESWRNVDWGGASGLDYSWQIVNAVGTAEVNKGELKTRAFDEPNLLDTATVDYYNIEKTVAIGARDKELNRDDDTKLDRIWRRRCLDAQFAIYRELACIPHNESETNQNGGLACIGPTECSSGTYAGITLSASAGTRDHWRPRHYDYGSALTLAANWPEIVAEMQYRLTVSSDPGGGGPSAAPDFGVCDPTAFPYITGWYNTKASWNINGGNHPANLNLLEDGFANVWIDGMTVFRDDYFGGDTGSVEGGATDEVFFGHSKSLVVATSSTKAQGFVRAVTQVENPLISGDLGVYKTGMFCFCMLTPSHFGLAYT